MHPHPASTPATPPLNVTRIGDHPYWISTQLTKHLVGLIEDHLYDAGVRSGNVSLRFSTEKHCLKRKGLTRQSLRLCPGSALAKTHLTVTAVGPNARTDICDILINLSPENCTLLKTHLQRLQNPVLPPAAQPVPLSSLQPSEGSAGTPARSDSATIFDETALALFLLDIRTAGGSITRNSIEAIASRACETPDLLIEATQSAGYLMVFSQIYSISPKGESLLTRLIDTAPPDDATKPTDQPALSELDRLKAAVRQARAQHQTAKAAHDARAKSLTTLTHQLTQAREALQSEELNTTTLQNRLQKLQQDLTSAQGKVTSARRQVLDLEEQSRALGADTPGLIQAERALQAAETAYQQLIAV